MRYIYGVAFLFMTLFFAACSVPEQTVYFKDNRKTDTTVLLTQIQPYKQSLIQSDDILAINISSISDFTEKTPVRIFNDGGIEYTLTPNIGGSGGGGGGGGANQKGYLVDSAGFIDYPVIGKLHVAGLTLRQIKTEIAQRLKSEYIKDPVVEVRILNYKVTVIGEVRYPGVVIAPNHRMNVMEALAAAGDITLTGRRDNVMVIREGDGKREFARIDLSSRNAFTNPYFVLKQNDIVYVEANAATRQSNNNKFIKFYLPVISSLLALLGATYAISQIAK
ncbi:MAG: polysaccharide export protein [Sphingobacteriales bacterium]|nr:MAG: polysaccharide export protein [Sphingobacteriales bacterium]